MLFDGKFSHAIRKLAKPGDFRVQDDHGGTVHDYQPDAEQIEFAEKAMAVCSTLPSYGRVDMVRDNQGKLALMELEMIEPELWLRKHPLLQNCSQNQLQESLRDKVFGFLRLYLAKVISSCHYLVLDTYLILGMIHDLIQTQSRSFV